MAGTKTSVYLSDSLREKLGVSPFGKRGASEAVSILADRYSFLLSSEINKLKKLFNEDEWEIMRAFVIGVEWKPVEKIRDGILHLSQDALDIEFKTMKVSRKQLEDKLQSLSVLQQFALVEELERFWEKINKETEELRNQKPDELKL